MENQSEACESFGAARVVPERCLNKHQRRVETSALTVQLAEAVQRIEIFGMILQERVVEPLRLGEIAALVRPQRAAQETRRIYLRVLLCRPVRHRTPRPIFNDR